MRNKVRVSLTLDSVFCFEEGDGWGNAEPYLWPMFFKIDGDTVRLGDNGFLQGNATFLRTSGAQGNLRSPDTSGGDNVPIPSNIGSWSTILKPIPIANPLKPIIKAANGWDDIPAVVGVVFVLMEEDNLSSSAALSGYDGFTSAFQSELNKAIKTVGLGKPNLSPSDVQAIRDVVRPAAEGAIRDHLDFFSGLWQWLAGPDQTLGSGDFRCDQDQLITAPGRRLDFSNRWKEGVSVGTFSDFFTAGPGRFIESGGEWELRGHVLGVEIPPPQVYQVECTSKGSLHGKPYGVGRLGVRDEAGKFHIMNKKEVMDKIGDGDRFFTVDAKGNRANVYIHEPIYPELPNYRHLTTSSDRIPDNNLLKMPDCK